MHNPNHSENVFKRDLNSRKFIIYVKQTPILEVFMDLARTTQHSPML